MVTVRGSALRQVEQGRRLIVPQQIADQIVGQSKNVVVHGTVSAAALAKVAAAAGIVIPRIDIPVHAVSVISIVEVSVVVVAAISASHITECHLSAGTLS